MGYGMALHLASKTEFTVLGFDEHEPTLSRFANSYSDAINLNTPNRNELISIQKNIKTAKDIFTPFPTTIYPDVVIFMVVNSKQIDDFLFSSVAEGKVFASLLPSSTTIIVMSTCSPSSIININDKLIAIPNFSAKLIDAPVSGGPIKAREGKLSIMLSEANYSAVNVSNYMNVLKSLSNEGNTLTLFPPLKGTINMIGSGSMAKTLHQLLAGVHIATSAEVLSLAMKCGIDLDIFYQMVIGGAAGNSWMFGDRGKRMIDSIQGKDVEIKSRISIFIKDLGIVLDEASKVSESGFDGVAVTTAPLTTAALQCFNHAVEMGLNNEDDSSLWKIFHSNRIQSIDNNFDIKTIVEVGDEPLHRVKLLNQYTRVLLVKFDEGVSTLPHTHSQDSVYLFLSPRGARVRNHIMGQYCVSDFMEFGEVRYGQHCNCPLTHRITAEVGGGGVLCVDAEVLSPPPPVRTLLGAQIPETEALEGHELVKVREKVRVFRLILEPQQSLVEGYPFFHLLVVCQASKLEVFREGVSWVEERQVGDVEWRPPVRGEQSSIRNVGTTPYSCFIVQWRDFAC